MARGTVLKCLTAHLELQPFQQLSPAEGPILLEPCTLSPSRTCSLMNWQLRVYLKGAPQLSPSAPVLHLLLLPYAGRCSSPKTSYLEECHDSLKYDISFHST